MTRLIERTKFNADLDLLLGTAHCNPLERLKIKFIKQMIKVYSRNDILDALAKHLGHEEEVNESIRNFEALTKLKKPERDAALKVSEDAEGKI